MFKKFLTKTATFGMAAIMTASLGMGVASADSTTLVRPSDNDRATVTVSGIEKGAKVVAYKVVNANYNKYGLISYTLGDAFGGKTAITSDDAIADITNITETEITNIASDLYAKKYTAAEVTSYDLTEKPTGTTDENVEICDYTASLPAGSYIVLVVDSPEETGEWVYNPAYVSVGYTDANDSSTLSQTASLDVSADKFESEDEKGNKVVTYVKKSYTVLDKDIEDASTGNTETEDVAIGDTVSFKVTSQIPYYSKAYSKLVYQLWDEQDAGLDKPTDFVVKVGDSVVLAGTNTYTLTITDNDWKIVFAESFIRNNPLKAVEVTYNSVVNENASIAGIDKATLADLANKNKTTLTYTTVPGETMDYEDSVNVYTFGIVATKVDADDTTKGLSGAEFLLTKLDEKGAATTKTYTATSDENGNFVFDDGIDVGTYTLVETKAPAGYFISDMTYTVEITAEYEEDADGSGATINTGRTEYADEQIKSWNVKFTDSDGNVCANATFDAAKIAKSADTEFKLPNTVLAELPTTGGMGTMALTGVAVVLFGTAAYLVFGKKKDEVAE
jgi:fimbrial isopeptide formation D2 family protein/LPXTG-motif cell wall-anchored protein